MKPSVGELLEARTAKRPRVLWIELTSRCPFDCIFCTRASLRGAGEHLDWALYQRLLEQLDHPQILRLNYAGESGHYPHLTEAVALAAASGAEVELVSALASLKPHRLQAALEAGLNRLTVSLHTLRADRFESIYRFGSLPQMLQRLDQVVAWRERASHPFTLDLAFVAMASNLDELPDLARFARDRGIAILAVHPLIGRDPLPLGLAEEHQADGSLRPDFLAMLRAAIAEASKLAPSVAVQVSSHELQPKRRLSQEPCPWPWPLPPGARIASCDQNPFETAHVLADGRVVVCEVTEQFSMGNLSEQSLREIWHGPAYRAFRQRHAEGREAACRKCIYKQAYKPGRPRRRFGPAEAPAAQLLRGWHARDGDGALWAGASAAMWLPRPRLGGALRLQGRLAEPGRPGARFSISIDGHLAHLRPWQQSGTVDLRLDTTAGKDPLLVEITCEGATSPAALGYSDDARELGFALHEVEAEW
jgi:MoaA/NifB/PqqE/SkfB family radical SAM enzyme